MRLCDVYGGGEKDEEKGGCEDGQPEESSEDDDDEEEEKDEQTGGCKDAEAKEGDSEGEENDEEMNEDEEEECEGEGDNGGTDDSFDMFRFLVGSDDEVPVQNRHADGSEPEAEEEPKKKVSGSASSSISKDITPQSIKEMIANQDADFLKRLSGEDLNRWIIEQMEKKMRETKEARPEPTTKTQSRNKMPMMMRCL